MIEQEFDVHIWAKDDGLFTVSVGRRTLAVDVNIQAATEAIGRLLEELEVQS